MARFYYVIFFSIGAIVYFVPKMAYYARHSEKYSEEQCYALAKRVVKRVKMTARVDTEYYGTENLPKQGGYIMFSNHQGKYDALGIINGHERPLSVLMDSKRSKMFIAKQFVDLLHGQRIPSDSARGQISALSAIAKEVREGRVYLVFPEGGYRKDQGNSMSDFKCGCFLTAMNAKCPIVPVALIDSYKPFGINSLRRVVTKVVYLPPIEYGDYCNMKAKELSAFVRALIENEISGRLNSLTDADRKGA